MYMFKKMRINIKKYFKRVKNKLTREKHIMGHDLGV